jgi:protein-tyrosine phosphatase
MYQVVENEAVSGGAIAVHCKAGLGRTGTLIGSHTIQFTNKI